MACRYYDDVIIAKLKRWIPEASNLRVLKPEESRRLFELTADDVNDNPFKLPIIALSRNNEIELLSNIKSPKSFDGLILNGGQQGADLSGLTPAEYKKAIKNVPDGILKMNVLPIKLLYQLDIYTKKYEECEEYTRNFLFKLINNPVIKIELPYNDTHIEHIANIRVLPTVSDTSAIAERIFSGQFTRYSIQLEIQDAFLFSLPYKKTWKLYAADGDILAENEMSCLEISNEINLPGEVEPLEINIHKSE